MGTVAFATEMVEAGLMDETKVWELLAPCLESFTEIKTDQLNLMLTTATQMQITKSRLWNRVVQSLQSRLEANLGIVFGSESPKSEGTDGSDEGCNTTTNLGDAAGVWDTTAENLVSMVNCVLDEPLPSHDGFPWLGSTEARSDESSESTQQSTDGASGNSSLGSEFSLFELSSAMFSGASRLGLPPGVSDIAIPETADTANSEPCSGSEIVTRITALQDFVRLARLESNTSVGQSRVQKWNESAQLDGAQTLADVRVEEQKHKQFMNAKKENERLRARLRETQRQRQETEKQKREVTKQLNFRQSSLQILTETNLAATDKLRTLTARHNEEMNFYKDRLEQVCDWCPCMAVAGGKSFFFLFRKHGGPIRRRVQLWVSMTLGMH